MAKTLTLHNTRIPIRESSFSAQLLCQCDVTIPFRIMHYAKIDFSILIELSR